MTPDELCEYLGMLRQGKIIPAAAAFNVKFKSAVQHDPANLRIIREGVKVLLKIFDDGLSASDRRRLKLVIRRVLEMNRAYIIASMQPQLKSAGIVLDVSLPDSVAALQQTLFKVMQNEFQARIRRENIIAKLQNESLKIMNL